MSFLSFNRVQHPGNIFSMGKFFAKNTFNSRIYWFSLSGIFPFIQVSPREWMNGSHNKVLYLRNIEVSEKKKKGAQKMYFNISKTTSTSSGAYWNFYYPTFGIYFHAHTTGYEFSFFSSCCVCFFFTCCYGLPHHVFTLFLYISQMLHLFFRCICKIISWWEVKMKFRAFRNLMMHKNTRKMPSIIFWNINFQRQNYCFSFNFVVENFCY